MIVVSAVALLDADGRMVTVRKRDTERFMNPGGKLEPGEVSAAAAVREVAEELGVELDIDALTALGRWDAPAANEPGATVRAYAFRAQLPAGAEPRPQAEIVEVRRVHPIEVSDLDESTALAQYAPLLVQHFVPALLADRSTGREDRAPSG